MKQKKLILWVLGILVLIKFFYLPWSEWVDNKEQNTNQQANFFNKQQRAIENEQLLQSKFSEHNKEISDFVASMVQINKEDKANSLWFSLIESIKNSNIKVYNQKVEFESVVTDDIAYIMGGFFISGNAPEVLDAIFALEEQTPYVFLEQVKLNAPGRGKSEQLVAQLNVGYWFKRKGDNKNDKF